MSSSAYEAYKEALRRGHVALLRERLDVALEAYGEAVLLAPDRAVPHVSLGRVLLRLGHAERAVAAFGEALLRSPADEAALEGRAAARLALGRRVEAADDLATLAVVKEGAGMLVDACDTARRALDLAESSDRRSLVERLSELIRADGHEVARSGLDGTIATLAPADDAGPPDPRSAPDRGATRDEPIATVPDPVPHDVEPAGGRSPAADPGTGALSEVDPGELLDRAEGDRDAGNLASARSLYLGAAASFRARGQLDAATEACLPVLAFTPVDTDAHLALAALYVDRGAVALAEEKLGLLARLAALTGDDAAGERIAAIAAAIRRRQPTAPGA